MGDIKSEDYEDYNTTSQTYDNWRIAVGVDSLENALELAAKRTGVPKASLKLLDVGCGTGNYIDYIKGKVGSCTGLEFNDGMLVTAKAKHKDNDNVKLTSGSATNMDQFESETFDIVIMTQVIQHIPTELQGIAFTNIRRVMKQEGVFWTLISTPIQLKEGFWWDFLIPKAAERLGSRSPDTERQIEGAGLKITTTDIPGDTLFKKEKYFDLNGPFHEEYRNADSVWSLATKEELEAALSWWKEQLEGGLADGLMKQWEERRKAVGQQTAFTCVKEV